MKRFKSVVSFIRLLYRLSKTTVLLCLAHTALTTSVPIITVMLSGRMIQQLADRASMRDIMITMAALVILSYVINTLSSLLKCTLNLNMEMLKDDFKLSVGEKLMAMPYEKLEDPRLMELKNQALLPIIEYGTFEYMFNEFMPVIAGSLVTLISTIVLIGRKHLILLLPILLMTGMNLFLSKQKGERFKKVMMAVGLVERKIQYFASIANDFKVGKDIRLFRLDKVIMRKIQELNDEEIEHFSNLFYKAAFMDFWETIFVQIQMYAIYAIVAVNFVWKTIGIGAFFQITGLFINLGTSIYQFFNAIINLRVRSAFIEKYMEFYDLPAEDNENGACWNDPVSIRLDHVSFAYENSPKEILHHVSLDISSGSTIAVVGENGSGKTTLVKLICGLLKPTKGCVLLDGKAMEADGREYISAIYQDYKLFSFTVRENIMTSYQSKENIDFILGRLNMTGVMEHLPNMDTYVFKTFESRGVEFSQGQGQTLAIARLIYKDAGIVIMDEPTASLDAKMEHAIFMEMKKIASGKTAVLVSHRLSACLFCDEIIVLDKGRIVERGSHDELLNKDGGKYREMYMAQAKYYNAEV